MRKDLPLSFSCSKRLFSSASTGPSDCATTLRSIAPASLSASSRSAFIDFALFIDFSCAADISERHSATEFSARFSRDMMRSAGLRKEWPGAQRAATR